MIGKKTEALIQKAIGLAVLMKNEYLTLEHLLQVMLDDSKIAEVLQACHVDVDGLRADLEKFIREEMPKVASIGEDGVNPMENLPGTTLGVQRLIQRALFHVQSAGKDEIQPVDLLIALFQAKESHALYLLTKHGADRLDVLNYISHGIRKDGRAQGSAAPGMGSDDEEETISSNGGATYGANVLENFCQNLNKRALDGKIDPLIGRSSELERTIQVLVRRRKNNPLLIGEAGVGKTAIAEGLAWKITRGEVPDLLKDAVIYSLDLGALLAGTKFRGDFEQRMKYVLSGLKKIPNPILFIDEIHMILGAGSVGGGNLDAANLLKPLLTQGDVKVIGSTTYGEYRNIFEKDRALTRRFQKIDIVEPTQEETLQILQGLKSAFENHHGVEYTQEALREAVSLSVKHLHDRFLPDKAIDVIDEVGAAARLQRKPEDKTKSIVDKAAVETVIAKMARLPAKVVNTDQRESLKNLARDLKISIFGQDEAISQLVTSIRLAKSGLRSGDKPIGSFLFCGPTGVGKTELTRQLALCMGVQLVRFDMSEYMEKHTVSRLIGAPPGYVGFEQAGLLTEALIKTPHAVVLLDEIEKAHPDLHNVLLQVMDYGMLTDNNGRKADFRNAIIIMTSNVGSADLNRPQMGIGVADMKPEKPIKAVEQTFSPEFRNRLDTIVYFNPLDPVTIGQVVGKNLLELETQLLAKHVEIDVDGDVREWLAKKGYDPRLGARPMARLITEEIKKPLSEEILFGKLQHGGKVWVTMKKDKLAFKYESAPPPSEKEEVTVDHSDGRRRN